jgi:hypothetical protein
MIIVYNILKVLLERKYFNYGKKIKLFKLFLFYI